MTRTPDDVRAALATAAATTPYDGARSWRDVLLDPAAAPGTTAFSRPGDPDRVLLEALCHEYPELDRHADTLAERAEVTWFEEVLRVPRLPVVPDEVVAHATADPKLTPVVVPAGTLLRGGKDAAGAERRYRTIDALTAHGATVAGTRSHVPGPVAGRAGLVAEAEPVPLTPPQGTSAPHTLRLHSPVLAFEGGTLTVAVRLTGAGSLSGLSQMLWRYPRPDGTVATATGSVGTTGAITVVLAEGCAAEDGDPWLELVVPADRPVPTSLSFTGVTLAVTARSAIDPQAAYYNDGALDVTKEFQPFGAVAKRGDALYLRSDEAFSKPLSSLTISVQVMQAGGAPVSPSVGGSGVPGYLAELILHHSMLISSWADAPASVHEAAGYIGGLVSTPVVPKVLWERRVDGTWRDFGEVAGAFTGLTSTDVSGPVCSQPAVVGGETGHHVRAFLSEGDFGWTTYQRDVAAFATGAATGNPPAAGMPTPPVPPVVSRVTLSYTTPPVAPTRVEAVNGWDRTVQAGSGTFRPFTLTVSEHDDTGMVALGLHLPEAVTGSTVSVYLGVESAAPCGSSVDPDARWQWWDGATWQVLLVADGTRLLRESGLLRFVAPAGWPEGCTGVGAETGRWVRLVTTSPERLGTVTAVHPDAVLARFVSSAGDPELDPSPATVLPPGTIKGTVSPVPGVTKVTNLEGVRGRGPEGNRAYLTRAATLVRHRGRAVTPWDYEAIVSTEHTGVAAVRCLPHTGADGSRAPGSVGLVLIPDRPADPQPRPSVSLAGRVVDSLTPLTGPHATPVVLCALYVPVQVEAAIELRRGVAALTGKDAVTDALETWLHPTGTTPTRWGRSLYRSSLESLLEGLDVVDAVETLTLRGADGAPTEVVEVDVCRGLYCSAGPHALTVREQL